MDRSGPKSAGRRAPSDACERARPLQSAQRLVDARAGAEVQQLLGPEGGALGQGGGVGKDLFGERLHGDLPVRNIGKLLTRCKRARWPKRASGNS